MLTKTTKKLLGAKRGNKRMTLIKENTTLKEN